MADQLASVSSPREPADAAGAAKGRPSGKNFGARFADELRDAVETLLDRQKRRAGDQIGDVAERLRRATEAADPANDLGIAQLGDRLAVEIEGVADDVRERSWGSLIAEVEAFARRQPAVFLLGTLAAGLAVERFLAASDARPRPGEPSPLGSAEEERRGAEGAMEAVRGAGDESDEPGAREDR